MDADRELDQKIADAIGYRVNLGILPPFSTSMDAAMFICAYFNNRISLYGPTAGVWNEYTNGPEWTCEITLTFPPPHWGDEGITATATTAPLAICRAALAAIERTR